MRAVSLWAASCVAGLVTFSCFGDSDDDDETTTGGKGGVTPEGGTSDTSGGISSGGVTTGGAEGTYDTCCIDNRTSECFCPAGTACNFGWFTDFYPDGSCCMQGDSTCSNGGGGSGGAGGGGGSGGEAGNPVLAGRGGDGGDGGDGGRGGEIRGGTGGEGGGSWDQCCKNGITSRCFCEAGVECNFGWDTEFYDDGTCCQLMDEGPANCGPGGAGGGGGSAGSRG